MCIHERQMEALHAAVCEQQSSLSQRRNSTHSYHCCARMSLTLNISSMYSVFVSLSSFPPSCVCPHASLHVWARALIHFSDACVWAFFRSPSPVTAARGALWPHGLGRDVQPVRQERVKESADGDRAAGQATLRQLFVALPEKLRVTTPPTLNRERNIREWLNSSEEEEEEEEASSTVAVQLSKPLSLQLPLASCYFETPDALFCLPPRALREQLKRSQRTMEPFQKSFSTARIIDVVTRVKLDGAMLLIWKGSSEACSRWLKKRDHRLVSWIIVAIDLTPWVIRLVALHY